jgi:hypothetical protein
LTALAARGQHGTHVDRFARLVAPPLVVAVLHPGGLDARFD